MTVYLDTSSRVTLYVSEAGSDVVRQLVGGANVVATSSVARLSDPGRHRCPLPGRGRASEKYRLRGFDSIHLASFVEVARRAGADTGFSSFDDRLNNAARKVTRTLERTGQK